MAKSLSVVQAEPLSLPEPAAQRPAGEEVRARIDAPHEARDSDVVPDGPSEAAQQLHVQADQLAAILRSRQRELDHREAELNARIALFDAESRSARLALSECEAEAAARDEVILIREQEVAQRLARLAAAEAAAQRHTNQEESHRAEASRDAAEHHRATADIDAKRRAVARRAEHLDQCRAELRRLRDELNQMHRDMLETRLATEELWTQLSGLAPASTLNRSLERTRAKLANQYRDANADLAERRNELEAIRVELARRYETLRSVARQG
jgi:chromosome segregation ATPase